MREARNQNMSEPVTVAIKPMTIELPSTFDKFNNLVHKKPNICDRTTDTLFYVYLSNYENQIDGMAQEEAISNI